MRNSQEIIELIFEIAERKHITMTKMAELTGIAKSSLSRYKNGQREFPVNDVGKFAKVLNVSVEYLLGVGVNKSEITNKYNYYAEHVSAGIPDHVDAITDADKISLPDSIMGKWAGNKNIYITRINGDSMDKVIPDNSLIAVKPVNLPELKNGDIVVFSNNHEYSVKYYKKIDDKLIFSPYSTNDDHYDQMYDVDDNIVIHGKVVLYIVEMD